MKKIFLITMTIILALGFIYYFSVYSHTKIIKSSGYYISYDTADDLIENSDLIIVATTNIPVEQREPKLQYTNGYISDFNTFTQVTIKEIIKQPLNFKYTVGSKIQISEPFAIIQKITGKEYLKRDEYTPLLTDKDYIIFTKINSEGTYCILNMDLGVYNITDNESNGENKYLLNNDKANADQSKKQYLNMKKDIAEKLNIQIKENK